MKYPLLVLMSIGFVLSGCGSEDGKVPEKVDPAKMIEQAKQAVQAIEEKTAEVVEAVESQTENIAAVEETVENVKQSVSEAVAAVETATAPDGEKVYRNSCIGCHGSGAANAPKLGDAAAWKPRIDKGMDALYAAAKNGIPGTAMMAKGTCGACSDEDLNAAVDYMVSKSQ